MAARPTVGPLFAGHVAQLEALRVLGDLHDAQRRVRRRAARRAGAPSARRRARSRAAAGRAWHGCRRRAPRRPRSRSRPSSSSARAGCRARGCAPRAARPPPAACLPCSGAPPASEMRVGSPSSACAMGVREVDRHAGCGRRSSQRSSGRPSRMRGLLQHVPGQRLQRAGVPAVPGRWRSRRPAAPRSCRSAWRCAGQPGAVDLQLDTAARVLERPVEQGMEQRMQQRRVDHVTTAGRSTWRTSMPRRSISRPRCVPARRASGRSGPPARRSARRRRWRSG